MLDEGGEITEEGRFLASASEAKGMLRSFGSKHFSLPAKSPIHSVRLNADEWICVTPGRQDRRVCRCNRRLRHRDES
jgi:hypothetical protein